MTKDSDHQAARVEPDPSPPPDEARSDPLAALAGLFDRGTSDLAEPPSPAPGDLGSEAPEPSTLEPSTEPPSQQEAEAAPEPSSSPRPSPRPHLEPSPKAPSEQEPEPSPEPSTGATFAPDLGGDLGEPSQQEADAGPEGYHLVAFDPPSQVGPLLPDPDPAKDPKRRAPSVKVPLAPIIGGGVTAALNGLILGEPTDAELTVQETEATGFPRAVEAALEHYFPELPIDHPLTAVIASGAALGLLVASKKGALAPPAPDEPRPAEDPGDDPTPEPDADPASPTGDPYWDAILHQAGGGAA